MTKYEQQKERAREKRLSGNSISVKMFTLGKTWQSGANTFQNMASDMDLLKNLEKTA